MSDAILTPKPFNFITDRLAIGSVEARAVPGWAAVVSILGNRDRPGDEWYGAPAIPKRQVQIFTDMKAAEVDVPCHEIDLCDGEAGLERELKCACIFIAQHLAHGCVLVHCGAGYSRSVAVVAAYLCRYMGMCLDEAVDFIKARRQGACPAPIFWEAITKWLDLARLAQIGPRV